jgi:hypothetical protein
LSAAFRTSVAPAPIEELIPSRPYLSDANRYHEENASDAADAFVMSVLLESELSGMGAN